MDPVLTITTAAIGVAAASAVSSAIFRRWLSPESRARRHLDPARRTALADARTGRAIVAVGRVRAIGEGLRSPIAERACVAYATTVDEHRDTRLPLAAEHACADFWLEDHSGRALIQGAAALVTLRDDLTLGVGFWNAPPPPTLAAFLSRHDESATNAFGMRRSLRVSEGVLADGEEVIVFGRLRVEIDPESGEARGYRNAPKRLVIGPPDGGRLVLGDPPALT